MTVGPFGAPDWLTTQPGGARALYAGSYTSAAGSSDFSSPQWNVAGFSAISLRIVPDQDVMVQVNFLDGDTTPTQMYQRVGSARAGQAFSLTVPAVSQGLQVVLHRIDNLPQATGSLFVTGHSASVDRAANRPPMLLVSDTNRVIGAGAAVTFDAGNVGEGVASWGVDGGSSPNWQAILQTFNVTGSFQTLDVLRGNASGQALQHNVWCPPQSLRVVLTNADGAAHNFYTFLCLGA